MKSALFVDFDNVYSGLRRLDPGTADQFARTPTAWMNWLIDSLELPAPTWPGARRRILVRRCYLNPQAYQRFRPSCGAGTGERQCWPLASHRRPTGHRLTC
ncbi:MAG: hypothetical protein AW09_001037 [Candidatus Accumulibacter phosphatis]|uniref:NYN domain-containing protein n=1 Tax=Candidatus Accumulibacter phosphatis TaxID=327160 RepID=A0A080LY22_9PROT|nr:MAG: hypothetical protein AW09_001037 [Candidatus Accumulibacter phosphatis]